MSGELHTPDALPLEKNPRYPLDRSLGGPQKQSRRRGEEKILPLPRLELRPLSSPALSQSPCQLRNPGSYLANNSKDQSCLRSYNKKSPNLNVSSQNRSEI
jgi:hypothetical protein